jgi:hypothetical protein
MEVKVLIGAEAAYACIKLADITMDVRLQAGRSAQQSLRDYAEDLRKQSIRFERNAMLASLAATQLDHEAIRKTACSTSHC